MDVFARLYGHHPYGRPVLGTREDLVTLGADELSALHRRHYAPDNAVLVVAGSVPSDVDDKIEAAFGELAPRAMPRPELPEPRFAEVADRLERRAGEIARLLVALPAPGSTGVEHAVLRLLTTVLTGGRSSRLHRRLVEERELALWIGADVTETVGPAALSFTLEVTPGVEPEAVEAALFAELELLAGAEPPTEEEVRRAKRMLAADWVFGHERIHHQALTAALAVALFDLGHVRRSLEWALDASREGVAAVAAAHLAGRPAGVVGWSLPR
jgi:predicted Zn-dependent peptidase